VSHSPAGVQVKKRALAADKPCHQCGEPIYYGYQGPIEGVCGRCADKSLRSHRRTLTRTVMVARERRSLGIWAAILLSFLAGAAAMYFAHPHLPF
jgi:hypothetical protein